MTLEIVVDNRLKKIKNELGRDKRRWRKLSTTMSKIRREFPATSDWEGQWTRPYEDKKEYLDAGRESYGIIIRQIELQDEKRYLHDLVRKGKK